MRFRPVFTVAGFAVLIISVVMLIYSLYIRNAYEIFIFSAVLLIWMLLLLTGIFGKRRLAAMEIQWKPPFPLTANSEEKTLVTGISSKVPWFFRLHITIKGKFFPSGLPNESSPQKNRGCPMLAETSVAKKDSSAEINLRFPMSGVFRGRSIVYLRDIFGFFAFQCGDYQRRTLNVMGRPCEKKTFFIEPLSGAEDQRNKNAEDIERYYMREYAPGDRFRDINWKSSERIDTLITRISPDTHEKICQLEVCFRNYGPPSPSIKELWLLDRCKAGLAQFLRTLKEINDKYIFIVHFGTETRELPDKESLENFLEELAGLSFISHVQGFPLEGKGGLYIFSTACDLSLLSYLTACQQREVSLFFTQMSEDRKKNPELLFIRDFLKTGCIPLPRWVFRQKPKKLLNIYAEGSGQGKKLELNYAQVRL